MANDIIKEPKRTRERIAFTSANVNAIGGSNRRAIMLIWAILKKRTGLVSLDDLNLGNNSNKTAA